MGPRLEFAIFILLNCHVVRLPSYYLCVCPQAWAALRLDQRSFLHETESVERCITAQSAEKELSAQL